MVKFSKLFDNCHSLISISRNIYNTCANPYQQPTYQKIKKPRKYRSSSQNIYQSVNNCHSLSKVETFSNSTVPTSAKIEVKCILHRKKPWMYRDRRIKILNDNFNLKHT